MKIQLLLLSLNVLVLTACGKPQSLALDPTSTNNTHGIFKWETEMCSHEGTYNTKKYSQQQLKDTYSLWFTYDALQLNTRDYEMTSPEKFKNFNAVSQLEKLEEEYQAKKTTYKNMQLLPGKLWKDLLKTRMHELEDCYELKKINIQAYTDPQILLNNRFTKHCHKYAEALTSRDTLVLLNAWKAMEEEKGTSNPTSLEKFSKNIKIQDRVIYARMNLMAFGWHNCANNYVFHDDPKVSFREEFEKIFITVTQECDEH